MSYATQSGPAPTAPLGTQPDNCGGEGGSYLLDPATGLRTRIEAPTAPPAPRPEPDAAAAADANASALTHLEG